MADNHVLLYDGYCALCNAAVRFVLKRDRTGAVRFAPLHGAFAQDVIRRHPGLGNIDSIVVVSNAGGTDERTAVRSDAVFSLMTQMGGSWRAVAVLRIIPRWVRDLVYDFVARVRYRALGRLEQCPLPPNDARHRFIP